MKKLKSALDNNADSWESLFSSVGLSQSKGEQKRRALALLRPRQDMRREASGVCLSNSGAEVSDGLALSVALNILEALRPGSGAGAERLEELSVQAVDYLDEQSGIGAAIRGLAKARQSFDDPMSVNPGALARALHRGSLSALNALISAGANLHEKTAGGELVMRELYRGRQEEGAALKLTHMMLSGGLDPNAKGSSGDSPAHACAMAGRADCLGALLEAGADANALNNKKRSPLSGACESFSSRCVEMLLGAGANPSERDEDGLTPLDSAARWAERLEGRPDLLESWADLAAERVMLLLNAGANVFNAPDPGSLSTLERASFFLATKRGHAGGPVAVISGIIESWGAAIEIEGAMRGALAAPARSHRI